MDFASDEKIEKQKARQMMEIARRITGELLTNMPERRTPPVVVECVTCHRGLTGPHTLTSQLINVATTMGADSAIAFYRKAREDHASDGSLVKRGCPEGQSDRDVQEVLEIAPNEWQVRARLTALGAPPPAYSLGRGCTLNAGMVRAV